MSPLPVLKLGPFAKGVADSYNPLSGANQIARYARNAIYDGLGRLKARMGTAVALTLMDDQGSPAPVTSVVAITTFTDGALAIGYSSITQKFYLYWLTDGLDNWYNISKVLQNTATPAPVGVLWTGATAPAPVTIAEGLGVGYIAHSNAGTSFQSMQFDTTVVPAVLSHFQQNLRGSGLEDTFFRGFVSFKQHLWGWGYGSQAANDNDRPELLRFSTPFFAPWSAVDNFAVGNRVRSERERVVSGVVAGEVLYAGTNFSIWPITGFGRNSWDKSRPLDDSYGFAGIVSAVAGPNGYLYYWSHRGPLRVRGYGPPEPLWPRIQGAVDGAVADQQVLAVFDQTTNCVHFLYQSASSGRVSVLASYDTILEAFLGPDGDIGIGVACGALVTPLFPGGPQGPPVGASTTGVGNTAATANWTDGDTQAGSTAQVEYQRVGAVDWTVATNSLPVNVGTFQITGLTPGVSYQWRVKNVRNGVSSAYLGPSGATTFTTTTNQLLPPSNCFILVTVDNPTKPTYTATVSWTNSGETGVSTEVHFSLDPSGVPASGTLPNVGTAPVGASSLVASGLDGLPHTMYAEVRHVESGFTPSVYSTPLATQTSPPS